MVEGLPIVVVGGGLTGLAVALGASRAGWPVRVVEAGASAPDGGLVLEAYAQAALAALGVEIGELPGLAPVCAMVLRTRRGEDLYRIDNATLAERLGQRTFGSRREVVSGALRAALPPEVRVDPHSRVIGLRQDESSVELTLENGRRVQAAAVIGADGHTSTVRARALGDGPAPEADVTWWHGLVPEADALVQDTLRSEVRAWWGDGTRAMLSPAGGGWWSWAVIVMDRRGRGRDDNLPRLRRAVSGWDPGLDAVLARATPERTGWKPHAHRPLLEGWGKGRVSLAGSAAHPTPPSLLQADSLALEDAAVLSRELKRGTDLVAALRAYERVRLPRARWFTVQSLRVQAAAALKGVDASTLRDRMAAILPPSTDEVEMKRLFGPQV